LDVKGAGRSLSMAVGMIRETGNHAIAGIWHEGIDLKSEAGPVRVERGNGQYALFAGPAANDGAAAVHVSEKGSQSFGDRYARNLAVTRHVIPAMSTDSPAEVLDRSWSVAGFTLDNTKHKVTACLDGVAEDYWIENPERHPFFQWPARGMAASSACPQAGVRGARSLRFRARSIARLRRGRLVRGRLCRADGGRYRSSSSRGCVWICGAGRES
jgi:hypothetical protein